MYSLLSHNFLYLYIWIGIVVILFSHAAFNCPHRAPAITGQTVLASPMPLRPAFDDCNIPNGADLFAEAAGGALFIYFIRLVGDPDEDVHPRTYRNTIAAPIKKIYVIVEEKRII
jgi:hypothetical protein